MLTKKETAELLKQLGKMYPDAHCALRFANPWQLLVATILSAQCTDARVNQVTPGLFARFPTPAATATADMSQLEEIIRPTGFFRNKAKSILQTAQMLCQKHKGQVPQTMDELIKLPGVGRKTANVVLGNAFATPGITVDTHVGRVSRRLGLTLNSDPDKIEQDLMAIVPHKNWTVFSHQVIMHGRTICNARKPKCHQCALAPWCRQFNPI